MAGVLEPLVGLCSPYLLVLLPVVALAVLLGFSSPRTRLLQKIPGPRPYPLIGNLFDMPRTAEGIITQLRSLCERYRGVCHIHLGSVHYVFVSSPEAAEPLLSSKRALDKGADYDPVRLWLGDGLLTSSGAKWHRRRKLITPTFHFAILEKFLEVMNEQSGALMRRLRAAGGRPLDVWPLVSDAALDTIAETAMGVSVGAQAGRAAEYKAAIARLAHVVHCISLQPWLRNQLIFRLFGFKKMQDDALAVLHSFTQSVIQKRRASRQGSPAPLDTEQTPDKKRMAFLDLLLSSEDDKELTDEDIAEEVDTFMFEGHDTTTSGIVWAMFNIARFPDIQRRIHAELDEVFSDRDTPPSRDDLARLKFLDCTIKESHRMFPPVPLYSRTLRTPEVIAGYEVPVDTNVMLLPHMLHRDPRHWEDPERFDPERHLPEHAAGRHAYALLPFSAGPRNCIGQRFAQLEEKATLSAVLRQFRLETCQEYSEEMLIVRITLQSRGPLEIRFIPRSEE